MSPDRFRNALQGLVFAIGGAGLFAMIGVDFSSVVARRLGVELLGSIEVVQLCIVVAVGAAILGATLGGTHAAVHLLVTRVSPAWRGRLERLSEAATVLAFIILCGGGGWVLIDLWPLDERSDLLHLPIAPARVFWGAALALAAATSAAALLRRRPAEDPDAAGADV